jgi:hypothetical protein
MSATVEYVAVETLRFCIARHATYQINSLAVDAMRKQLVPVTPACQLLLLHSVVTRPALRWQQE